ncbi:beta-ketoacyl-[acyl-carrier-protein] synthase family protein [Pseudovibrio sp. POLY-S9]|uniref:beta-ketoacyl-[acyl-carrier-protein] synthase family protein n=1 Tax=Pseudovibrio sp. POLY-S9 TaxID=1576596 RepID=UPI000709421B|nr:beta-ketoacyl-[acyl-carrier-protein] synthase family protein [Pseudovibrio sp. POLY-S9]
MAKKNRVVVTGYGATCSLGKNSAQIWDSITKYQLGYFKKSVPSNISSKFFGDIQWELDTNSISKALKKVLPRFGTLGMLAAEEAITMAFGQYSPTDFHDPMRCGAIFGTGWGASDELVRFANKYQEVGIANPMASLITMHSIATAAFSKRWSLRGYQNTPIAACATGSLSIGDAFEHIRHGRADFIIAGGGESIREDYNIWNIDILGALSREQADIQNASCPFSLDRTGFVLSEGAAVLCLEDYNTAKRRKANILGELIGYGSNSDAYDWTSPASDGGGRIQSIRSACMQADIDVSEIDYVNAHGTSTILNDLDEVKCLKSVFGKHAYSIPISSTKSYTGHLIAAAGAIESIFCLKSIQNSILPATANLQKADPDCDLDFIPHRHRHVSGINTVLNVNYGFGGANSALIFRKAG